ncbi:MAG: thiolase domain-containing protein [Candidatus Syntropharchaeia archaeon]
MRKVAIIGIGCTKFGELWDRSFREIAVEAGVEAIEDAGIRGEDIDALIGGNMSAGRFVEQEHIGALIADHAGLAYMHVPSSRVEGACASGGLSAHIATLAVASGYYDIVVAAGIEKMTDVEAGESEDALVSAIDREWEGMVGANLASLYAIMARAHMERYGTTREQLAAVAVKNHKNAKNNPKAQYRGEITIESVINSPLVSDPLRMMDCSSICDGAAAIVLADAEIARKYTDTPIYISASTQASDTITLADRRDITTMDACVHAAKKAFKIAKIDPEDVDVAEVHDSYTIGEIIAIEDLGFFKKGEGGKATEEGMTSIGGKIPINPSGGLKACGHPLGATGIRQIVEIVQQLRGEAGKRQVEGAEIGLTQNIGGTGATAVIHILSTNKI